MDKKILAQRQTEVLGDRMNIGEELLRSLLERFDAGERGPCLSAAIERAAWSCTRLRWHEGIHPATVYSIVGAQMIMQETGNLADAIVDLAVMTFGKELPTQIERICMDLRIKPWSVNTYGPNEAMPSLPPVTITRSVPADASQI